RNKSRVTVVRMRSPSRGEPARLMEAARLGTWPRRLLTCQRNGRQAGGSGAMCRRRCIGSHKSTLLFRGLAAAPHEQQMGCAFHERGIPRPGFLQPREVVRQRLIKQKGRRIPAVIRDESIVEYVEAAQIVDVKWSLKPLTQLTRGKQMKRQCQATPASQFDLAQVQSVIETEVTRLFNRIDESRWRAANRTDGGDEMPSGHTRDFHGDLWQARDRQMAQDTVKAESHVD